MSLFHLTETSATRPWPEATMEKAQSVNLCQLCVDLSRSGLPVSGNGKCSVRVSQVQHGEGFVGESQGELVVQQPLDLAGQ